MVPSEKANSSAVKLPVQSFRFGESDSKTSHIAAYHAERLVGCTGELYGYGAWTVARET